MLVKFSIPSGTSVSMFEKDALALIKMMNYTGTIPSAIADEDVHVALSVLKANLAEQDAEPAADDEMEQMPLTINVRAYPLIELLEQAIKKHKAVMWEHEKSFF